VLIVDSILFYIYIQLVFLVMNNMTKYSNFRSLFVTKLFL